MNIPQTTYSLPKATAQQLTDERIDQCKNPGLLLDKYIPQAALQNSKEKGRWLHDLAARNPIDAPLASHVYRRWLAITTAMGAHHFQATTNWRLATGMGSETVLETGLTLHPLYGLPLIPGSTLKGLCRTYVTGEIDEHRSKHSNEDDETIRRIFGSGAQSGTVVFFDAMPLEGRATLTLDITNSHYPHYYTGKKPPTNDQRPNPVTFLTITDTIFVFALAQHNLRQERQLEDVEAASQWLQEALREYGVGARTSAGYGYLTPQ